MNQIEFKNNKGEEFLFVKLPKTQVEFQKDLNQIGFTIIYQIQKIHLTIL